MLYEELPRMKQGSGKREREDSLDLCCLQITINETRSQATRIVHCYTEVAYIVVTLGTQPVGCYTEVAYLYSGTCI